jgi:acyl-CoA reductase-like NAD-dependent aldehyde dehydrogenase
MMDTISAPVLNTDRVFIDGKWVKPSNHSLIDVIDPSTEQLFFQIAEAGPADIANAVEAARRAFDDGPWARMSHVERAGFLREIAIGLRRYAADFAEIWTRESGVVHSVSRNIGDGCANTFEYYANLASAYPFEEPVMPTQGGEFGLLVREPVGVVGAIIPWNGPLALISAKVAPALLAGCTVVLKSSPEAPGEAYVFAEIARAAGLPRGVVNVLTADRKVSELLVRDERVDKITFTGSTAAGRRIASLCGKRIARCTLELGGKSAAVILNDMDLATAADAIAGSARFLAGQVCSSLSRIVVARSQHKIS